MTARPYHYTESGLDTVYLLNGYEIVGTSKEKGIVIQNIDGLHQAISRDIISNNKKLSGSEFRYLRTELLMSQALLAQLLHVRELTIARWEKGQTKIPLTADATIRLLYQEHIGGNQTANAAQSSRWRSKRAVCGVFLKILTAQSALIWGPLVTDEL